MASLGTLAAQLKLDGASQMMSGLGGIGKAAAGLRNAISSIQGPLALLGVSFAAFKSVGGIADGLKGVFEAGRELQTLSRVTGESVGNLKMLQGAFNAAGIGADALPGTLRLMEKALGGVNEEGQPTATVFQRLGLNINQLRAEAPAKALAELGNALRKLPNQALEVKAATDALGRSGAELLALFNDPEAMAGLGKGMSAQAQVFQRSSAAFARIAQDLQMISGKVKGAFVGIADQVAPVLLPLLDKLKAIDLLQWGEQAGRAVRVIAAAFSDGRIGELFGAALEVGVDRAINYLVGAMAPAAQAFSSLFGGQLDALVSSLEPLVDGLSGLLGAGLLKAFEEPVRFLQSGIEAALQTAQHLADIAAGKKEDTQGYGMLSDAKRKSMADQYDKLAEQRFDTVREQGDKAGDSAEKISAALEHDSYFQNAKKEANALRNFDPSKFVTPVESLDDIRARHAAEPVRVGLGAGQTADEWQSSSLASLRSVPALMAKASSDVMGTIRKFFTDFKPANVMDETAGMARLSGLLGQLKGLNDTITAAPQAAAGQGLAGIGPTMNKAIDGDRLAKIGGFIGGGGGPALDFHKRTAAATEATSKGVQKLIEAYAGADKSAMTAVWA